MYMGFGRFLGALCVVGLAMGATLGIGIAVGRGDGSTAAGATPSGTATAQGVAQTASGGGAAGLAALAGVGTRDAAIVSGTVQEITPTSMVVRVADGSTVSVTLNAETIVRKTEAGSLQDVQPGAQVLVTRDSAAAVATNVQLVPAGTTLPAGRGALGVNPSATPGGRGTPPGR
jgi:hypothetical protein